MTNLFDDVHAAPTYVFWSWFFRAKEMASEREKLSPFKWGDSYDKFVEAISLHQPDNKQGVIPHQVSCPICHEQLVLDVTDNNLNLGVYHIEKVACLCVHLRWAEDDEYKGNKVQASLSELKPIDQPTGSAKLTKIIIDDAEDFIRLLGNWRYLSGGYGSGKTHILHALKTQFGSFAAYWNTASLTQEIFKATRDHNLDHLTEALIAAPVFLFDDLGAENKNSDYMYSVLYNIINGRYERKFNAPTYITSNVTIRELDALPNDNIRRIADRLADTNLTIQLVTKQASYRRMK